MFESSRMVSEAHALLQTLRGMAEGAGLES
jgi:hypothetical protein